MNTKQNRRVLITKRIFQETLLDLLETNHISEISVKGLCDAADLNRSTFYHNYQNQMDILKEIETETYDEVEKRIMSGIQPGKGANSFLIFVELLKYIRENKKRFLVLLGNNGSLAFQKKLLELTLQANNAVGNLTESSDDTYYDRIYRIAGCTRVIEQWILRDFYLSPEILAQQLIVLSAE